MRKLLLALVSISLLCPAALAQPSNCSDGTFYDDGVYETGTGFNETNVTRGAYAMKIDPPFVPAQLKSVCLCWVRSGEIARGDDSSISFNLNVWDGSGTAPGALLGRVTGLQATNVTTTLAGSFSRFDLSAAGIVANGPVFIGPDWNTHNDSGFFLCEDQGPLPPRPTYLCGTNTDNPCTPNLNLFLADVLLEALGIRAKFDAPTSGCIPSDTALCLNQGRFKVEATFQPGGQPQGTAHVVKLTDETGYLWFFSSVNVEAVVKVINACTFNQRFWVYAGGLTDVQVTLKVTDTATGAVKTYTNPQGAKFQPIQDSSAFATCP